MLQDGRALRPVLIPKLRPGRGQRPFEHQPIWHRWSSGTGCWSCNGAGCADCVDMQAALQAQQWGAHEPPAYPAEKLDWSDRLAGTDPDR
jgi:hypothetical protein